MSDLDAIRQRNECTVFGVGLAGRRVRPRAHRRKEALQVSRAVHRSRGGPSARQWREGDAVSVTVQFSCGGCDAKAEGTHPLRKEFVSVSGRSYGIGLLQWACGVENVVPEGWVAFDPYTGCTYCPKCWAEIIDPHGENIEPVAARPQGLPPKEEA